MDEETHKALEKIREVISLVLRVQTETLRHVGRTREAMADSLKAAGEILAVVGKAETPEARRKLLDALWAMLDPKEILDEIRREIARLETLHEKLEADLDNLPRRRGHGDHEEGS